MIHGRSPVPRRKHRHAERTDGILRAALAQLAQGGIESLTMQQLAESVHYTPGALYRYFPSKEALIAEVQRLVHEEVRARIGAALHQARLAPAIERLEVAARAYLGLARTLPHHVRLIGLLLGDPRHIVADRDLPRVVPSLTALLGDVEALFAEAAKEGSLRHGDARDRAIAYWAALQGVVQLQKLQRIDAKRFDSERLGRVVARALLSGWGMDRWP